MSESTGKIKLFHIVESFGGGVFTALTQIVNNLDPHDFDISIVYSLRPEITLDFKERFRPDIRFINLPMVREIKPFHDLKSLYSLWKLLKNELPHVVHLHSSKAGVLGRIAARFSNISRVFYSPHGFSFLRQDVDEKVRNRYRLFERIASYFGGTVIACSEGELDAAKSVASRVVLIPNSIDIEAIDRLINPSSTLSIVENSKITVGTAGRITPARNPALFGKIAKEITLNTVGMAKFLWVGGGENVYDLSGSPVEITGWLSHNEAIKRIAEDIDIFLHTSLWEGMPIAILEAMALSKPLVATDIIGNRDVVKHGETGFLCKDFEELVQSVLKLVKNPDLRKKMGEAGRSLVEKKFSLTSAIKCLSALYKGEEQNNIN